MQCLVPLQKVPNMFSTFIPNNTASDGSLTLAIDGLRALNSKMKEHFGVDISMWDSWLNVSLCAYHHCPGPKGR